MGIAMNKEKVTREGSLEAPTRHPLGQQQPQFWQPEALEQELERVFDVCHGCRRCVSLCNAFPTLFDLVDESDTLEVDGVDKADYQQVVDQCYLCDLCFQTKCPYVPPHEWNIDFPHLMLRAKAVKFKQQGAPFRDRLITSTDQMGKVFARPVLSQLVNAANGNGVIRAAMEKTLGIHAGARLPPYRSPNLRQRLGDGKNVVDPTGSDKTPAKVVLFTTCYCNYNEPDIGEDLVAVLHHNDIEVRLLERENCCGMPKLELGDLDAVKRLQASNIPQLYQWVQEGWELLAPIPSCVLMFKQELPLMYPDDQQVQAVAAAFYDPFEYLYRCHREGRLKLDFKQGLGNVSYHVACHLRVQKIGLKTRDVLQLVPDTKVTAIERCSGHDGTYAVKTETHAFANKLVRPVTRAVQQQQPDHYGSDCPMAGAHIEANLEGEGKTEHPMKLLRQAYGI